MTFSPLILYSFTFDDNFMIFGFTISQYLFFLCPGVSNGIHRLSGLSPFMGSNDVETMTNVTIGKYDFDDEAFSKISKEALDFISKLLVKDLR